MRSFLIALLIAVALPGHAGDDSLYRAFGEKRGLATLMSDFVGRLQADAQIGRYFKDVKAAHLAEQLTDQLCKLAGGPCVYEGATMAQSHRELEIDRAAFHRLVELLQDTMDTRGIPFATQNQMLALLAPMHRDIVTR